MPSISTGLRRLLVVVNFVMLVTILLLYYARDLLPFGNAWLILIDGALVVAVAFTYYFAFVRSGAQSLTQAKPRDLDEREIKIAHAARSFAYRVFTVISLFLMWIVIVAADNGLFIFDALMPTSLLYVALALPSAYVAWLEKAV